VLIRPLRGVPASPSIRGSRTRIDMLKLPSLYVLYPRPSMGGRLWIRVILSLLLSIG
jgi:hypothetical protein